MSRISPVYVPTLYRVGTYTGQCQDIFGIEDNYSGIDPDLIRSCLYRGQKEENNSLKGENEQY
jgi:hypothetical protein